MGIEKLPCLKVKKERGEEVRRVLKDLHLLQRDARINCNDKFIYLPVVRVLKEEDKNKIGDFVEFSTKDFEIFKRKEKESIEEVIGFKPSYEVIGDIAVLTGDTNSVMETDEQLIGEEIMKRHKSIKVVAKRASSVEGVFRKRKIKIIAGENRTETTHKENDCKYKLDLEKVYFNPRLAAERNRVASQVKNNEEVIDMFAGVGSFSIQIAKRASQSSIIAIDINPDAIKYLQENVKLNKIRNVEAIEGDVREVAKKYRNKADRIIMNLPKSAHSFLREALSILSPKGGIIHYYDIESSYASDEEKGSIEIAINKAKEKLMEKIKEVEERSQLHFHSVEILEARKVKPYAPYAYIIGMDVAIKK